MGRSAPEPALVMDTLAQDLRFAARMLARQPGFALTAVLCLAIGIGANATMFGVVDTLLLRPPPHVRDADAVVRLYRTQARPGMGEVTSSSFAYPDLAAFAGAGGAFSGVAAFSRSRTTLGLGPDARSVEAVWTSHSFFPVLGVRPVLGRFFTAGEDRVGSPARVAVLSHELWQREYGGDASVLGEEIRFGGEPFTVIGVAPAGFTGVDLERVDVWVPVTTAPAAFMGIDRFGTRNMIWLDLVARLEPGVTAERAAAGADAAYRAALAEDSGALDGESRVLLGPVLRARGPEGSREATVSVWVAGVSLILLLIACINVANLLLTRGAQRRREIAVRLALGVGRGRLIRQLVTESLLVALLGAAGGLLVVAWGGAAIRLLLAPEIPALAGSLDARVLGFTALVAILTGLLCGLAPALQVSRPDLGVALKSGGAQGGGHRSRLRSALLAGQVALTLVLLIGAALFIRSLYNVNRVDLGLEPERVLVAGIDPGDASVPPERVPALYDRMLERAEALPGVEGASLAVSTPFRTRFGQDIRVPGRDSLPAFPTGGPFADAVSPGFFATVGLQIRRGRGFAPADRAGAPAVAVVNETLAGWLWPGEDPIGRCFHAGGGDGPCIRVVGVVEDSRRSLLREPDPQFFLSLAQDEDLPRMRALLIRTTTDPERMVGTVRRALQSAAPGLPFVEVVPLEELIAPQTRPWRLGAAMFGIFGLVALGLALVGLYGVLAFYVSQRTREIGVRLALGARGADVVGLFVGHGMRLVLAGVAIGCVAAYFGARALTPHLFGVSGTDPATFALVALLLVATAVAASSLPARRASRVDPAIALRTE